MAAVDSNLHTSNHFAHHQIHFVILAVTGRSLMHTIILTHLTVFRTEQEPCWRVFSRPHRWQWHL